MRQLEVGGFNLVPESSVENEHIVVINTCGFINDAKEESIETILRYAQARKKGKIENLFVMGCLSQRYKKELADEIHEVDGFFGVSELPAILKAVGADYQKELLGERHLTTPSHFAYLKISEGCDRTCSFCAIPHIRGKHQSKTIEEIVAEAKFLASNGVKELLLIAQDLTYYGLDIYKSRSLSSLLKELVKIEGIEWIRLHYAYPAGFPEDVLEIMATEPKICKYLDIPLQHISDKILKSMHRNHDAAQTRQLITKIREQIPGIALRTTMIVGYPGETESDFEMLKEFVKEARFERLGVFTYSAEENTTAHSLPDDVSDEIKQQRANEIMEIQEQISLELNKSRVGETLKVIIDRFEGGFWVGRSQFDSPEVDNEILIPEENNLTPCQFYAIKITGAEAFDLFGEVQS
jgi:ribosomal protein S12 methylthiotransferase